MIDGVAPSDGRDPKRTAALGLAGLLIAALLPAAASAEVRRWVDAEGTLHIIQDGPPPPSGPTLVPRVNCPEARERYTLWAAQQASVDDATVLELEVEMMRELAALCPSDARIRTARADLSRRLAAAQGSEAPPRLTERPDPAPQEAPLTDLARALTLFHDGRHEASRDLLARIDSTRGYAEPEIGYQLGMVELALGNGAEAVERIETYLRRSPDPSPDRLREAQAALVQARALRDREAAYEAVEGTFDESSTRRFHFRWDGATAVSRERGDTQRTVERYLELAYSEVGRDLGGAYPREPIEVIFYSPEVFKQRFSHMTRFAGFWDGQAIRIRSSLTSAEAIKDLIYHEYTHALVTELAGGRSVPSWLNEGLAEIEERRAKVGLKRAVEPNETMIRNIAAQAARNYHPPLSTFEKHSFGQIKDSTALRRTYSRAYVAVSYLYDRVGMRGIVRTLRGIGSGKSFDDAFGAVYAGGPDAFERDFNRYLEDFVR